MRENFDEHRDVWGPALAVQLRLWAELILKPARQLQALGLTSNNSIGLQPEAIPFAGGGPSLVELPLRLNLLDTEPEDYERVGYFDIAAAEYRSAVEPFSEIIFEEVLKLLAPYLVGDARILDPSSGPGTEAIALARRLPAGQVVAADLSRNMIEAAFLEGRRRGVDNMAFYQADAQDLPLEWNGCFDAVICLLSFHFYSSGEDALGSFHRVLKPNGKLFIADPGVDWFITLSEPLVRRANPGLAQYRSGQELVDLLKTRGFHSTYWTETLPGIGIAIASRDEL